ncbi:hypothetical protein PHYBOEH_007292 [Phytophthora boehmeriae]|uniref:Cytochrome P450 n=1 Tax=Phytophthora boehmeriae TaxID=109152 RepID=A0A8T1XCR6_9STRA|nr:hypothetical protein PHYBOEH_007292 [Phytophthora boehmeriae]
MQVLRSSGDKGGLIETLLSTPAWLPVVSLESVNGEQWQRMKNNFTVLQKTLPPIGELTTIFESRGRELLQSKTVLDAFKLNELVVAGFYEWLFKREFNYGKSAVVCQSTWEWRKEIAMKGIADPVVKQRTVDWCVDEIRRTPHLYEVFGDLWEEPEYYSLILQPFLLSPAINLTDIAVLVGEWAKATPPTQAITPEILRQCICSFHPFPVVERFFPDGNAEFGILPNTQVLIPLDEMSGAAFAAGIDFTFGAGSRVCVGRHMAMKAMVGLFTDSFVRSELFCPKVNHKYSGRHNDGKETLAESLYQFKFAVRVLSTAAKNRLLGFRKR